MLDDHRLLHYGALLILGVMVGRASVGCPVCTLSACTTAGGSDTSSDNGRRPRPAVVQPTQYAKPHDGRHSDTHQLAAAPHTTTTLSPIVTPVAMSTEACNALYEPAIHAADQLRGEFRLMGPVLRRLHSLGQLCGGTFVELGANDGINSHSKFLEARLGWRGVCIEAAPGNFAVLETSRPMCHKIHAVVWHKEEDVTFRSCTDKLYGHSGLLNMRTEAEWDALIKANKGKSGLHARLHSL